MLMVSSSIVFQNSHAKSASRRSIHSCGGGLEGLYEMEISSWIETTARCSEVPSNCMRLLTNFPQEQQRIDIENNIETWCERLLEMQFEVSSYAIIAAFLTFPGSDDPKANSPARSSILYERS